MVGGGGGGRGRREFREGRRVRKRLDGKNTSRMGAGKEGRGGQKPNKVKDMEDRWLSKKEDNKLIIQLNTQLAAQT